MGAPCTTEIGFLFRDLSASLRNKDWKKKLEGEQIPIRYFHRDAQTWDEFVLTYEDEDLLIRSIRAYLMEALEGEVPEGFLK